MQTPANFETARLADQLERSYRGGAWHGPALAEALAGVDAETAARAIVANVHSIAELTAHVTYWLDAARRRITGEPEVAGDDWEVTNAGDWSAALETLERTHRALHTTVLALDDPRLDDAVEGSDPTVRGMLLGLLQHNAYHAGQISLLAKAAAEGGR